jgi:uncharacterized protein (DUF1778 family)
MPTRVEARIAPDVPAVVRRAAELKGCSLSEFLVAAIGESQIIRLSVDDQQRFADLLLNPPPPAPAMDRAFKAHARLIREAT